MPTPALSSQPQGPWLVPLLNRYLTRSWLQATLQAQGVRLYWRTLTPLVVLWGLLYQRLHAPATLDDVVSALHAGAADGLDPADPHPEPVSVRLCAVSTAAYNQARQRLPLGLIQAVRAAVTQAALEQVPLAEQTWHGHRVRGLDGTTLRLPPEGDLEARYGRASGRYGPSHWVTAQAVVTFCWATWLVVAHAESAHAPSETSLVRSVLADEPAGTIAVGDRGFGIYRTAQVAAHLGQHVVLRLDPRYVPPVLGRRGLPQVPSGTAWTVCWAHRSGIACEPELPTAPVPGRVLYTQLIRPGFRPHALYLFTTLTDAAAYPLAEIVALYAERWQVELRYRDLKTTLHLEYFAVRSAAMFAKELEVGLLAYTVIRLAMLEAAPHVQDAQQLAFAACRRRVRDGWAMPGRGRRPQPRRRFRQRLAACRVRHQPHKVAHEPRAVRRTPQVYPALKGSRDQARQAHLAKLGAISS